MRRKWFELEEWGFSMDGLSDFGTCSSSTIFELIDIGKGFDPFK